MEIGCGPEERKRRVVAACEEIVSVVSDAEVELLKAELSVNHDINSMGSENGCLGIEVTEIKTITLTIELIGQPEQLGCLEAK